MANQTSFQVSYAQGAYAEISRGDQWTNYVSIDLANENGPIVFIESNFGSGCSMASFNGFERAICKLPNDLTPAGVQMVFDEIKDRYEADVLEIYKDREISGDRCILGEDANEAMLQLEDRLSNYVESGLPCYWSAGDYFDHISDREIGKCWMSAEYSSILEFWEGEFEQSDFIVEEDDAVRYLTNSLCEFVREDLENFIEEASDEDGIIPQEVLVRAELLKAIVN